MDKRLSELYQEERNKLSQLPCADDDFIALEKASIRREKEKTDYALQQKEKHQLYKETLQLKHKIYSKYPTGGVLHVVLDDGNLKNSNIEWCIEKIEELEEDKELFLKCANNLLKMTQTQRLKLYKA
jgi:hypothetical protein